MTYEIRCNKCRKTPDQIQEYVDGAAEDGTTPAQFVIARKAVEGLLAIARPIPYLCSAGEAWAFRPIFHLDR